MPIYVYHCSEHGSWEEFREMLKRDQARCPICAAFPQRDYSAEKAGLLPFRSYWTEALTSDPVHVSTREQERALLEHTGFARVK